MRMPPSPLSQLLCHEKAFALWQGMYALLCGRACLLQISEGDVRPVHRAPLGAALKDVPHQLHAAARQCLAGPLLRHVPNSPAWQMVTPHITGRWRGAALQHSSAEAHWPLLQQALTQQAF